MQEHVTPAVAQEEAAARESAQATRGFLFALSAYLLWGLLPLYMKAVAHIPAVEVVAHRVLWSVPIAGVVLLALGRTGDIAAALRSPRTLAMAALTAAIISVNWGIYVWAIAVDRTVETALGYYINPLVTVLLGAALLGERLDRLQVVAVTLAALAVLVLTVWPGAATAVVIITAAASAWAIADYGAQGLRVLRASPQPR